MAVDSWKSTSVADCLVPVSVGGKPKIDVTAYRSSGSFPIIDQGQDAVAGWTNDEETVIDHPLPLIVFGDHTRTFKFVDYPFARGADGTQLLKPCDGIDPLFFFYACRAIDLPSRGYNRHFRLLKEQDIMMPLDTERQRVIGSVLHRMEGALNRQEIITEKLQELKAATMQNLFTRGLRGDEQKDTELGLVPVTWALEPLGNHHTVVSGGTPSRADPAFWTGGTVPWVKTAEVNYCTIRSTEERITAAAIAASATKLLPKGTLLMAMYGQGVTRGKVAILGIEAACNQACAAIRPSNEVVVPGYLYHFLTFRYDAIRQMAHGGQQQNLNLELVRSILVAYPQERSEQCEIAAVLDAIDRKIEVFSCKRTVTERLFEALLHKLATGELRTEALDLAAYFSEGTAA